MERWEAGGKEGPGQGQLSPRFTHQSLVRVNPERLHWETEPCTGLTEGWGLHFL